MADNETIADIIAEMRALSNTISDGIIAINGRIIADRLEAAHRREAVTGSNQFSDAEKLREALAKILGIADHVQMRFAIPKLANQEISELKQIAEDALKEGRR